MQTISVKSKQYIICSHFLSNQKQLKKFQFIIIGHLIYDNQILFKGTSLFPFITAYGVMLTEANRSQNKCTIFFNQETNFHLCPFFLSVSVTERLLYEFFMRITMNLNLINSHINHRKNRSSNGFHATLFHLLLLKSLFVCFI